MFGERDEKVSPPHFNPTQHLNKEPRHEPHFFLLLSD